MDSVSIPLIDIDTEKGKEQPRVRSFSVAPQFDLRIVNTSDSSGNLDNLRSLIHQHAREGNASAIDGILSRYPDLINSPDEDGLTALHYAARYSRVDVVRYLLERMADPRVESEEKQTPLHLVAKYCKSEGTQSHREQGGDFVDVFPRRARSLPASAVRGRGGIASDIIGMLIEKGALVDAADEYGLTALHYAAMKKNYEAAESLIDYEANVNAVDENAMTPLLTACVYGSEQVVRLLLESRAEISQCKDNGRTNAFHIAAQHGNDQTLKLLIKEAHDRWEQFLDAGNNEGKTPLFLAVEGNHADTAKLLLAVKKDKFGYYQYKGKEEQLLHVAASKGYINVVEVLIEYGADIRRRDEDEQLPIHIAAQYNHAKVVEYLIKQAPNTLDARNEYGLTPLLLAASSRDSLDSVQMLIQHEANLRAVDNEGRSIVFIAAKYNSVKTLEFVLNYLEKKEKEAQAPMKVVEGRARSLRVNVTLADMVRQPDNNQNSPMHIVAHNGYLETCKMLHAHGAPVLDMNEDEETPLHLAAIMGRTETVRQLLEWDPRLVLNKDEMGNTALHLAARYGHDQSTKALLDAGADKESRNARDETPLEVAVAAAQIDTVRQLVERGAIIENKDDQSCNTPLHMASSTGDEEIVRFLLRSGASIDRRNPVGQTALDIALLMGRREVARALVEHSDWRLLMTSSQEKVQHGRHTIARNTPLRELLAKFPDLVSIVFDKCISSDGDMSNYNYAVQYDFSFIDDTYIMTDESGESLVSPYEGDDDRLMAGARAYTDDYDVVYKNHPLKIMANSEKLSLLSHPLVLALIKYKWNSLGRYVYYLGLSVYMFFITLYTVYVTQTPAPYNVFDATAQETVDLTELLASANASCDAITVERPPSMNLIKFTIIALSSAQLLKEGFQLCSRRLAYLTLDNAIECFIYLSAIVTVMDISHCSETTGLRMTWQWLLAAVCVFMCWMNLLLLIRKLPRFGIYVVMFFDILRTFSRFFIIFVLFVVAFSIAFFVILQNRPEFSTLSSSVLKTTVMMIGEFEFTAIFHGDASLNSERLFGSAVAYPLFLVFCVIMTILLMNLLVGLAVDDIKSVQEKAELKRLVMQIDLVLQVETSIPYFRKKVNRGRYRFFKNQESLMKRLRNRFGFESTTEEMETGRKSEEEELVAELRDELRQQGSQIKNLQANIDVMYEKQLQVEGMMRSLLRASNIDYQETDVTS